MDVRKYEVFLTVVEKGSFIQAANVLGYTQSGITHMMNRLEAECGFTLLIRSNKGVCLTPEGEKMVPYIENLIHANQELEQAFETVKDIAQGSIRIGCFSTVACMLMPKIFSAFRKAYPAIAVDIVEDGSVPTLERWLASGFIDIAFFTKQPVQKYDWVHVMDDEFLAVLPKTHPLAQLEEIPAKQLMSSSLFTYRSIDGIDVDVMRYFKEQNVSVISTFTANSDTAVLYMLDEGMGLGMQPKLLLDSCLSLHPKLTVRPLVPRATRDIGLAITDLKTCSLATRRFVQFVQHMVEMKELL